MFFAFGKGGSNPGPQLLQFLVTWGSSRWTSSRTRTTSEPGLTQKLRRELDLCVRVELGRADHLGDPLRGLADLVVDARLLLDGAAEPGRGDAHQGPPALDVDDEGTAAVPETSVLEKD